MKTLIEQYCFTWYEYFYIPSLANVCVCVCLCVCLCVCVSVCVDSSFRLATLENMAKWGMGDKVGGIISPEGSPTGTPQTKLPYHHIRVIFKKHIHLPLGHLQYLKSSSPCSRYRKNSKNWDTLNYYLGCPTNGIVGF